MLERQHGREMMARRIEMTPEMTQIMVDQRARFLKKFGREPGPNDPVFFDPDQDVPTPWPREKLQAELLKAMQAANIPEAKRRRLLHLFGHA
jgi:hypothetical protein